MDELNMKRENVETIDTYGDVPLDIKHMLYRNDFALYTPEDIYKWFKGQSFRNQKTMLSHMVTAMKDPCDESYNMELFGNVGIPLTRNGEPVFDDRNSHLNNENIGVRLGAEKPKQEKVEELCKTSLVGIDTLNPNITLRKACRSKL